MNKKIKSKIKSLCELRAEIFNKSAIKDNKKRKVKVSESLARAIDAREIKESIRSLKTKEQTFQLDPRVNIIKSSVTPQWRASQEWFKIQKWAKGLA